MQEVQKVKAKGRNGFLDFLKFIFAIIIVIGHGDTVYGTVLPDRIIPLASFGVDFFFVVSGAMLLKSMEKQKQTESIGNDTYNFIKHKIKGLMPNYYIAWLILFLILCIGKNIYTILLDFFKAIPELLFLVMSGMPTEVYNGNTWYISVMLLAILILYPLIRKNKDFFIKYIAPVIAIFGLGCISHSFKSILVIKEWNGFMYWGLIRGIAEICIGCITYELSDKLKNIKLTNFGTLLTTIIEVISYVVVIAMLFCFDFRSYLFVLLFILMVAISITLSGISYSRYIFSYKIFNWMGEYSYSLYLGHSIAYTGIIKNLVFNKNYNYSQTLIIYFVVALIAGLIVMYISKLYSFAWNKNKERLKKMVIASN